MGKDVTGVLGGVTVPKDGLVHACVVGASLDIYAAGNILDHKLVDIQRQGAEILNAYPTFDRRTGAPTKILVLFRSPSE